MDKTSDKTKIRTLLSKALDLPLVWHSLSLACALVWYGLSFHSVLHEQVTLPLEYLNTPRTDLGWLSVLAAGCIAGLAVASIAKMGDRFKAVLSGKPFSLVAAGLCAAGTCLNYYDFSLGLISVVVGGMVAGLGFSALLISLVLQVASPLTQVDRYKMACWGLGFSAIVMVALSLALDTIRGVLLCCLPFAMFVSCAEAGRRQGLQKTQSSQVPADKATFLRGHVTVVVSCVLGVGLFSGTVGFSADSLAPYLYSAWMRVAGVIGSLAACALFVLLSRKNPEGPYIFLPVLLGTSAVLLLATSSAQNGIGANMVFVAGRIVDDFSFVLSACLCLEIARTERYLPVRLALLVSSLALLFLLGIILGGVFVSIAGVSMTTFVVVAVTLVYTALLGLGLSTQQRDGQNRVVVTSSADIERIARAQAQAIVEENGTLTPREREILPLLVQHRTIDSIAEELCVSRNTVKSHVKHIYEKLGVDTRQQLQDRAAAKTINL